MIDYSKYEFIKVERRDKVLLLTLNRPEVLNAIHGGLDKELSCIFREINDDQDCNVVVVTGAGRAFCAGGDIKTLEEWASDIRSVYYRGRQLIDSLIDIRQPTIAMVNGVATGLGASIALHCDIVIASEKARFGDAHIWIGVVPGDGGCIMWPLLVGVSKAKELLMTGDLVSAAEADKLGLVNRVVPAEELEKTTFELANRLAKGPSIAIQFTKQAINKVVRHQRNLVFDESFMLELFCLTNTEDHKEAIRAFAEKRPPVFKGR